MASRGFGYIEFFYIDGAKKAQDKIVHVINGKRVFSKYQVPRKWHQSQPIPKKHAHQQREANKTEFCFDRKLYSLDDKTDNYLPNECQSQIGSKGSVILKGNGDGKKICEKNDYDQAKKKKKILTKMVLKKLTGIQHTAKMTRILTQIIIMGLIMILISIQVPMMNTNIIHIIMKI